MGSAKSEDPGEGDSRTQSVDVEERDVREEGTAEMPPHLDIVADGVLAMLEIESEKDVPAPAAIIDEDDKCAVDEDELHNDPESEKSIDALVETDVGDAPGSPAHPSKEDA